MTAAVAASDLKTDFLPLTELRKQFESYMSSKADEIDEAREARRYYNHVQWTEEQIEIFRARKQPVVTYPRIGRKIDGIVGIAEQQRQDPKAYPRNPENAEGADIATCVVRYVTERNEWASKKPQALRQALVDGIAGIELRLVQGDQQDLDVEIEPVQTDDFFYDPRSIRTNFTDARFMGLSRSLDVDEAIELFPDQEAVLTGSTDVGSEFAITSDRKNIWRDTTNKQVLVVEHWYKWQSKWRWAFYVGWSKLAEGVSPFEDERGKTMCRFEMFSAYVDQDGDRYGMVRALKGMQDEINHRRCSALYRDNTRQIVMERGAVDDIDETRKQAARPDGVIEHNKNFEFQITNASGSVAAQMEFLQDAKNEMEGYANVNPAALAGGKVNLSGRAVNLLQKPGLAELGPILIGYRNWVIRVYRAIWNTTQRYWESERWVRVTDDQNLAQFIQINGLKLDEYGRPAVVNKIGALDVDIILDEGPDVQNMMQDAWDVLSQMPPGTVPLDILVELMPIPARVKEAWTAKMNQAPDPAVALAKQLQLKTAAGEIDKVAAETALKHAQALSALGSAAHKGSEAHLNAASIFDAGLGSIQVPPPAVQGAQPLAQPAPPSPPVAPPPTAPVPGAMSPY